MEEYPFELRVSARRKKTAAARMEEGRLVVTVPSHLSPVKADETARALVKKFWDSQSVDLQEAAEKVAANFLPELGETFSLHWVDNQSTRWASCTISSGRIRVSSRLRRAPSWVLEAVLLHELAHLIEPSHNKDFKALIARDPRTREAEIFLEGFTLGLSS